MTKITIRQERCKGCSLCVAACPKQVLALSTQSNAHGYRYACVVNGSACVGCVSCAIVCPDLAILLERENDDN